MKYTMELTNKQKAQMDCIIDIVHRYVGFNPKLEMIETTNVEDTKEYQIGYKVGLEDGNKIADKDIKAIRLSTYDVAYSKGVEDFENLFVYEHDYEQFFEDTYGSKDPDYNLYDLVAKYGAKKVIDDLKKWEEKKKAEEESIKVGDEVYLLDKNHPIVVTSVDNDNIVCLAESGKYSYFVGKQRDSLKKTGRHFDEVEQLLSKLRGHK